MKNALPSPHTARSATSCPIDPASAHSTVATTISTNPVTTVRLGPNRALNAPVMSIATTCTPRYDENSNVTCSGPAFNASAMDSRIGSTRPIPMNAITAANAVIHTALGCPLNTSNNRTSCPEPLIGPPPLVTNRTSSFAMLTCLPGPPNPA